MRQTKKKPLSSDLLRNIHAYWRTAKYLSIGRMYLDDNPLPISGGTLKRTQEPLPRA
jgi:phosphoketolase